MSEYKILNNSNNLIVCFGGMAKQFGLILPFEFLNYLSKEYGKEIDLYFYVDMKQCWYHKGIHGITKNIDETKIYLDNIISNYKKVIFMGVSAGGYASLLFGSLCNVSNVISFIPRTKLIRPLDEKYIDINEYINNTTKYLIYGDTHIKNKNHNHHISQCERINNYDNLELIKINNLNMKNLRDNGVIKDIIDSILNEK